MRGIGVGPKAQLVPAPWSEAKRCRKSTKIYRIGIVTACESKTNNMSINEA